MALMVIGLLLTASQVRAAEDETGTSQSSREFEEIKTRLAVIDQQQKQILANQQETFERLDQLRIWVHRK